MSDFAYSEEFHILQHGWCQVFERVSPAGRTPVQARVKDNARAEVFAVDPRDFHEAALCPLTDGLGTLTMCVCCGHQRRSLGRPRAFICGRCLEAGCAPSPREHGRFGFFHCMLDLPGEPLTAIERQRTRRAAH